MAQKSLFSTWRQYLLPPQYTQADYDKDISRQKKKLDEFCRVIPAEIEHYFDVWGGTLPHIEILKCAGKKGADLIVMGSHTKEKGGKWYVGSAVERVSYRSIRPVVVITDPKVLLGMDFHKTLWVFVIIKRGRGYRLNHRQSSSDKRSSTCSTQFRHLIQKLHN